MVCFGSSIALLLEFCWGFETREVVGVVSLIVVKRRFGLTCPTWLRSEKRYLAGRIAFQCEWWDYGVVWVTAEK